MPTPIPMPRVAPTDNLYKFLSLFGLTVLIVAIVLLSLRVSEYNQLVRNARVEDMVAMEKLSQAVADEHNSIQGGASTTSHAVTTSQTQEAAADGLTWAQQTLNEAKDMHIDLVRRRTEIEADRTLLEGNQRDLLILMLIASIISVIGFFGWYFRLQQPQDELLKARVAYKLKLLKEHRTKSHAD